MKKTIELTELTGGIGAFQTLSGAPFPLYRDNSAYKPRGRNHAQMKFSDQKNDIDDKLSRDRAIIIPTSISLSHTPNPSDGTIYTQNLGINFRHWSWRMHRAY